MKVEYVDVVQLYGNDLNFKVMTQINSPIEVYQKTLSELDNIEMNKTLIFHFENSLAALLVMRKNIEESFKYYQDKISGCGTELEDLIKDTNREDK